MDPDRDNLIGSTGGLTEIFLPQIIFLWKQTEYSPLIGRFCYDTSVEVTKSSSRLQEWMGRLQVCADLLRRRLQEFTTAIQECPIYNAATSVLSSSSSHRGSESHANSVSNLHSFIFIGKPRKDNNASNVHFSLKVERELSKKNTQLTCDDGKAHDEWLVGDSG